jgi:hypothetical protein
VSSALWSFWGTSGQYTNRGLSEAIIYSFCMYLGFSREIEKQGNSSVCSVSFAGIPEE